MKIKLEMKTVQSLWKIIPKNTLTKKTEQVH